MISLDEYEMELLDKKFWSILLCILKECEVNSKHGYWTDGEEVLCGTEEEAEHLADFLEDIGFDYVNFGYYDPKEDEMDGTVDEKTGLWYVSVD